MSGGAAGAPSVVAAADRRFPAAARPDLGSAVVRAHGGDGRGLHEEDVPEPERYLEELIVDFALVAAPDASNRTSADLRLMVPARAEETGADADGGEAVTDTTPLAVAAKSYIRVLPARSGSPSEVDATTTPYLAIDRLLAAFEDDAITTTADAASVAAILTPDLPGTYVVLITAAVDACNAASHAFVNVTTLCSHVPRPAVASAPPARPRWDQARPPPRTGTTRTRSGGGRRARWKARAPRPWTLPRATTSRIRHGWTPRYGNAGTPPRSPSRPRRSRRGTRRRRCGRRRSRTGPGGTLRPRGRRARARRMGFCTGGR